ncbi:T9SS type A sorting domain-containing protein [Daejeonella oryzae]|uniref:T9SS type A sorting domain-containing protein n=1 Tax=Daejeonella oryzae TaxID=1122943 RepID=UPI0004258187|nr:T9SS type A sorting domain-containing protein [Daejeonella oryzae]
MIIFTKPKNIFYIFLLFNLFVSFSTFAVSITFTGNVNNNWGNAGNWSPAQIPTSSDAVIIPNGENVTIDIAVATCSSLNQIGDVTISSTNSLLVTGVATLDQSVLTVGNGYFYVGGNMNVIGNGNANQGVLAVSSGTVIVNGSIYFWKDAIGTTGGSTQYRLLDISGTGSITLGGTLVGNNGSDATTLAKTKPESYIFKGNSGTNYWNVASNWSNGLVPTVDKSVIIPFNLTVNLDVNPTVTKIDMYSGAVINLVDKTLTLTGNLNNNGGNFSGNTGTLKFSGTSVDQTYTGSSSATVPNILIDKSAKSLELNGALNVSNLVTVTNGTLKSNGNLTLLSSASSYAQIGPLTAAGAVVSGIVNVQSWLTGGAATNSVSSNANRGTRTLSSPVNDLITSIPIYKQLQSSMYITGSGDPGFDLPGSSATILTYNEPAKYEAGAAAQYTPVTSLSTRSAKGQGFFLFYRGNRTSSTGKLNPVSGTTYATPESFPVTYQGVVNQGDITVDLSYTNNTGPNDAAYNGFNLIGNPYPATIDWTKVVRSSTSNIDNMVSVIKPGGGMTTYSGGVVVNGRSALPAGATAPSNTANNFYIQPGQGFYVRARASGTSITFKETSKAVTGSPLRLLHMPIIGLDKGTNANLSVPGSNSALDDAPKAIYFELSDQFHKEEAAVVFEDGNDSAFGPSDATYFPGSTVALSTLTSDGKNVSINFMPQINDVSEISLVVNASVGGDFKLKFTDLKAAGKFQILLQDQLLNTSIDVKENPEYNFSIDKKNLLSYGAGRFKIVFNPPAVEIKIFEALAVNQSAELNWTTSREKDNDRFEVERSIDGVNFEVIGQVKGSASSQTLLDYKFIDQKPFIGNNFYRLKQIETNRNFDYSETLMLKFEKLNGLPLNDSKGLNVFPNPASNEISVNLPTLYDKDVLITIFNTSGGRVKQIQLDQRNPISADVSNLMGGLYILELTDAKTNEVIGRTKFIKN